MKIVCDYDRCASNGLCEETAPEYFEIQDNGDLDILQGQIKPEDLAKIEEAVRRCPTQALSIVE